MFKVIEDSKPVMGRLYTVKNMKTGHIIVGCLNNIVRHPKQMRKYEQPAHFYKKDADVLCAELNEDYDNVMKGL